MLPPVRVREVLEASRRAGLPFGEAWFTVLDSIEDEKWREALAQTANTWRRAYLLEPPTECDRAVDVLSRGLAGELANLDAPGHCPVCDNVVERGVRERREKTYCSHACQRIANGRRELLDVAA
jgi:hypothetical protein